MPGTANIRIASWHIPLRNSWTSSPSMGRLSNKQRRLDNATAGITIAMKRRFLLRALLDEHLPELNLRGPGIGIARMRFGVRVKIPIQSLALGRYSNYV